MCDKAVNRCFFVTDSIPNQYKTQEMCDRIIYENPFSIRYFSDQYGLKKCVMRLLMIV